MLVWPPRPESRGGRARRGRAPTHCRSASAARLRRLRVLWVRELVVLMTTMKRMTMASALAEAIPVKEPERPQCSGRRLRIRMVMPTTRQRRPAQLQSQTEPARAHRQWRAACPPRSAAMKKIANKRETINIVDLRIPTHSYHAISCTLLQLWHWRTHEASHAVPWTPAAAAVRPTLSRHAARAVLMAAAVQPT